MGSGNETLYIFGGYTKEEPYYLDEWWTFRLGMAANPLTIAPLRISRREDKKAWKRVEPSPRKPMNEKLTARTGHTMNIYQDQVTAFTRGSAANLVNNRYLFLEVSRATVL